MDACFRCGWVCSSKAYECARGRPFRLEPLAVRERDEVCPGRFGQARPFEPVLVRVYVDESLLGVFQGRVSEVGGLVVEQDVVGRVVHRDRWPRWEAVQLGRASRRVGQFRRGQGEPNT